MGDCHDAHCFPFAVRLLRVAILLLSLSAAGAAVDADEVKSFPGFEGKMPSRVYSGYVKASAGNQTFYSHYVLTESQGTPQSDPLVLWQQGGPGSSGFGFGYFYFYLSNYCCYYYYYEVSYFLLPQNIVRG